MESIKIQCDFTGIICINEIGITAYDLQHNPITFDLIFNGGYFNIHNGIMYESYTWHVNYMLFEFLAIGQGIYHIDMMLSSKFNIKVKDATVYLPTQNISVMNIHLINATLSTKINVINLDLKLTNSVLRGINIINFTTMKLKNSQCYIDMYDKVFPFILINKNSLIYVKNKLAKY
jgi:hypothetical protein